jgi:tetratricopeptide (TPR) repeat protein
LTRSQLEEAIRNPVEKAGGTIEPELVERLLNDCGDEVDQLPVLQQCLMRLWDRAGAESPVGNPRQQWACLARPPSGIDEAIRIATAIESISGDKGDKGNIDVIEAHLKKGDLYKEAAQHPQALAEYQYGLTTGQASLAKRPDNFNLLRTEGKALFRIAEVFRTEHLFDDARAFYRQAAEVQEAPPGHRRRPLSAQPSKPRTGRCRWRRRPRPRRSPVQRRSSPAAASDRRSHSSPGLAYRTRSAHRCGS